MNDNTILDIRPLGFPWETADPFLFCAYHLDAYPAGNEEMGPNASLEGRRIGNDFEGKDGWRMYHGETVPGFPHHPHRGFETVTIARQGFIDHSDSLGATARFGEGDVQWLTAGKGINHSEMFPLLNQDSPNTLELFQIWLNLPSRSKMVDPYFTMFWKDDIAKHIARDDAGRTTEVTVIAGPIDDENVLVPPPDSWASQPESDIAIWTITMEPGARWTMPAAKPGTNRRLYFFRGTTMQVDEQNLPLNHIAILRPDAEVTIDNGDKPGELLLLQGRPIGEPVAQYGPFVMNTEEEIRHAFDDYRRTHFGGWPWASDFPVHPREKGRFARQGKE